MRHAVSRYSFIALVVVATLALVRAQESDGGRIEYLSKCAECHGADGRGAGPISGKLKIKPGDLTLLAKRNNGVFSQDAVAETVDGRSATKSHRISGMPIWGCRQGAPPASQGKAHELKSIDSLLDLPCDPEPVVRSRIEDVVEYIGQIQEK